MPSHVALVMHAFAVLAIAGHLIALRRLGLPFRGYLNMLSFLAGLALATGGHRVGLVAIILTGLVMGWMWRAHRRWRASELSAESEPVPSLREFHGGPRDMAVTTAVLFGTGLLYGLAIVMP